jgi:hypothetical protein
LGEVGMTADLHAPWRGLAACTSDPVRFDVKVRGESTADRKLRMLGAATVCIRCPVRVPCLAEVDAATDTGVRAAHVVHNGLVTPVVQWLRDAPPVSYDRTVSRREHGTTRGYYQHRHRQDMPACEPCLEANRVANRARQRASRKRVAS